MFEVASSGLTQPLHYHSQAHHKSEQNFCATPSDVPISRPTCNRDDDTSKEERLILYDFVLKANRDSIQFGYCKLACNLPPTTPAEKEPWSTDSRPSATIVHAVSHLGYLDRPPENTRKSTPVPRTCHGRPRHKEKRTATVT